MDSNSERNRTICANSAEEISKLKARSTPSTRIVYIIPPKIIETDAANFRAIVQKLTGKDSARSLAKSKQKKFRSVVSHEKSESSGLKDSYMAESQFARHHLCSKRPGQPQFLSFEDQHVKVKSKGIEDHSFESWDNIPYNFDGDVDLDMLTPLIYSGSTQSGFPAIDDLTSINQTDYYSSIFRQSEIDLYQQLPFR
ncbi:hypothetical protein SUGI_0422450 [Cryptomeria japonica]|nr:hypothetical protein SUGI_0422450 [Cryptomeria japonica]